MNRPAAAYWASNTSSQASAAPRKQRASNWDSVFTEGKLEQTRTFGESGERRSGGGHSPRCIGRSLVRSEHGLCGEVWHRSVNSHSSWHPSLLARRAEAMRG